MANKQQKSFKKNSNSDNKYFLKLLILLVIGCFWIKFIGSTWQVPLPLGLIIGLYFANKDKQKTDKKIEFALLLVAMFVGFWLPIGLYINL